MSGYALVMALPLFSCCCLWSLCVMGRVADAEALEHAGDYAAATEANERRIARRHDLPVEVVRRIGVEGVSRGWGR